MSVFKKLLAGTSAIGAAALALMLSSTSAFATGGGSCGGGAGGGGGGDAGGGSSLPKEILCAIVNKNIVSIGYSKLDQFGAKVLPNTRTEYSRFVCKDETSARSFISNGLGLSRVAANKYYGMTGDQGATLAYFADKEGKRVAAKYGCAPANSADAVAFTNKTQVRTPVVRTPVTGVTAPVATKPAVQAPVARTIATTGETITICKAKALQADIKKAGGCKAFNVVSLKKIGNVHQATVLNSHGKKVTVGLRHSEQCARLARKLGL